jgi:cell division septation protein DedD
MKLRTVITVLPGVLLLVQGCDFFRSLAGRPTSAELAALQCPAPADTARAGVTDSAAVIPGEMPEEMIYRSTEESYLVVAGCFREPRHADRLAAECRRQGYETCIVDWHGLKAVGLCPTGDRAEAQRNLRRLVSRGVCPGGSWVMEKK